MQLMHIRILQCFKTRIYSGLAVLALVLSVLAGCASDGKVKAPADHEPSPVKQPSVSRHNDNRTGFVITEVPKLDEESRRDFDRATAMLKDQNYSQAIDLLEKVARQSPGVTAPHINLAIAYQRVGKPEQAEEHLETALKLFPGHPVACNEYGMLYRRTGRFAEARKIYEKGIAGFPDYFPLHRNLGILCDLYQADLPCALEHFEIYIGAMPEDKQVKAWIADLRGRLGRN
jgi:Tfp pilus assembly protein PilF